MRQFARASIAVLICFVSGCTRQVPGVLTLAPAGMQFSGTCTPDRDGTLTITPGASASSSIYADAGPLTIAITANAASADQPAPMLELWFDGRRTGEVRVESTTPTRFAFQVEARRSGPAALRIAAAAPANGESAAALHAEKIVITQP